MGRTDDEGDPEVLADGLQEIPSEQDRQGGRGWRRLLSGGQPDEFTEKVAPLSDEQREHLARVTDELMKRYTISRTADSPGADEENVGEVISADEISAVLETVLAEAFDFAWFDRADLPEAPELELDPDDGPAPATQGAEAEAIRGQAPLVWSEAGSDPEMGELVSPQDWMTEAQPRTGDDDASHEGTGSPGIDDGGGGRRFEIVDPDTTEIEVAEREVVEMEQAVHAAVEAEAAAARVTMDARERLAEAKEMLVALESFSAPRRTP